MVLLDYFFYPWGRRSVSCTLCGIWIRSGHGICQRCWGLFESQVAPTSFIHPLLPDVRVRALVTWVPCESDFLSVLFQGMKGSASPRSWEKIAWLFLQRHDRSIPPGLRLWAAPSQGRGRDHALIFARALQGILGAEEGLILPLGEGAGALQKRKNRRERLRSRETRKFRPQIPVRGGNHVIIDDIFTTGSTTFELARGLGWPWKNRPEKDRPHLEIWVLSYRSRLAP